MKEIAIVGGGIAGLCTGMHLLHNGFHVTIYEKQPVTGGCAKKLFYRDPICSYVCDSFASIPVHLDEYQNIFLETNLNPCQYYRMIPSTDLYHVFLENGANYQMTKNIFLSEPFEKFFKEPLCQYKNFVNHYQKKYTDADQNFLKRPFLHFRDLINPSALYHLLRLNPFKKADKSINKFISSSLLQYYILFQTLYMGQSPYKLSNLYTSIPACTQSSGLGQIKGGIGAYVQGLESAFLDLGGQLKTNSCVSQIAIQGKKASGIIINNELYKADGVTVCTDFNYAMSQLLPNANPPGRLQLKHLGKNMSCSVFLLRIVFTKLLKNFSVHNIFLTDNFLTEMMRLEHHLLPENPPLYLYYPAAADESFCRDGFTSMNIMMRVPNLSSDITWNQQTINKLRSICIQALNKIGGTSIQNQICKEFYSSPLDLWENFNYTNGAAFGILPDLKHSLLFRPQAEYKKIKKLYFAGSSIHPGNGISIVMKSAKIAAQQIIKDFSD